MTQGSFLIYNNSRLGFRAHFGFWEKIAQLPENHFVISDSQGKNIWKFVEQEPKNLENFSDLNLGEFNLPVIDKADYLIAAQQLVDELKSGVVQKVVYSRVVRENFQVNRLNAVFHALAEKYPDNLTYCFLHPEMGCWLGSTPETLIRGAFPNLQTMALAGTLKADAAENSWTNKELEEQSYVTDFLMERIATRAKALSRSERYTKMAGPVKHLCTDLKFELAFDETFDLIQDIHPTPAVCGVPTSLASQIYQRFERHNRSLYTGFLGFSSKEKIDLFVNLRCMQIFQNACGLYVGGGFTKDSNPEAEWHETERKAQTLLGVMRNSK